MNAVNLIPDNRRTRRAGMSLSAPMLGVLAGLVLVLVATVVFVSAHNTVTTRRTELARVQTGVDQWSAAADSYSRYRVVAQRRTRELGDVRSLVSSRYDWSELLGQLAGLMPKQAAISSLQATTPVAPSATASTDGSTTAPGIQLSGCAASQSVVAATMVALRQIVGVSRVTLSSSARGSSGSAGAGGCSFPVQFQVSLAFASAAGSTASAGSTPTTGVDASDTTGATQ